MLESRLFKARFSRRRIIQNEDGGHETTGKTYRYFPEQNIRFIAVNDMVDSAEGENEIAPFKNIMNEMYAGDISRKVRSARRIRGNLGEPLSQPPYGYVKSPENKKFWVVEPEAAAVVRQIFRLCIEGKGNESIARTLERQGVLTPMAYWQSRGLPRGGIVAPQDSCKWKNTMINKILHTLTAPLLQELIDHIDVYETEGKGKHRTQRVVIYYRFVGYIDLSDAAFVEELLAQENHKADTRQGVAVEYLPEKPKPEHRQAEDSA